MRTTIIPIRSRAAFTIIEVMIVLVVAAAILLIVFFAVPALQRSSRNNARKAEVARIAAAYQEFVATSNGVRPTTSTADKNKLVSLAGGIKSLDAVNISLSNTTVSASGDPDYAYIRTGTSNTGGKCNAAKTNAGGPNPTRGNIAIVYYIETLTGVRSVCLQGA